jgi:AcrR family transcriptional regulator
MPKEPPPTAKKTTPPRLTAETWAQEALTVIGENGLAAVAVEPIAKRLGATKGSFYWHFPNRQALVEAALEIWEQERTDEVIAAVDSAAEPAERLRSLLVLVVGYSRNARIEVAMLASAHDPSVASAIERVTRRRIDYVASLYQELGVEAGRAQRHATVAVSVYLGHTHLAHISPQLLPGNKEWDHYLEELIEVLTLR